MFELGMLWLCPMDSEISILSVESPEWRIHLEQPGFSQCPFCGEAIVGVPFLKAWSQSASPLSRVQSGGCLESVRIELCILCLLIAILPYWYSQLLACWWQVCLASTDSPWPADGNSALLVQSAIGLLMAILPCRYRQPLTCWWQFCLACTDSPWPADGNSALPVQTALDLLMAILPCRYSQPLAYWWQFCLAGTDSHWPADGNSA